MDENKEKHECCGGHNHDAGEGCGCGGHNHHEDGECCGGHGHHHDIADEFDDHEVEYITITLEDGKPHSCAVLGSFCVDEVADKEFLALLPEGSDEVIIFSFVVEGEEVVLDPIPDDEFEFVSAEFMNLFGEENFE